MEQVWLEPVSLSIKSLFIVLLVVLGVREHRKKRYMPLQEGLRRLGK